MKQFFTKILAGFEFTGFDDFATSLIPSFKYGLMAMIMTFSIPIAAVEYYSSYVFGLNLPAVVALIIVMIVELLSGLHASKVSGQKFSSSRFSRFTVKTACYLVLISVPYLFKMSYEQSGNGFAAGAFDWLHVFLTVQIVAEHVLSILENLAIIQGKPKTYWIDKIKSKLDSLL